MKASGLIWSDGELIAWDEAQVHFLAHALHYGLGVFEGIRSYETAQGAAVFRLDDHIRRLHQSAKAYEIPLEYDTATLKRACREVVASNGLIEAYIRPLAFFAEGSVGINPAGARVRMMIAAWHWDPVFAAAAEGGITVQVSSWRRLSSDSFIPTAKGSGQYLNSSLALREALRNGYDEALLLNGHGNLSEASAANVFMVRGRRVLTPPVSAGILAGITRDTVMALLASDGIDVIETDISRGELYLADELFYVGTAAEIVPIRKVDGRSISTGKPGPITRQVQQVYRDAVTGQHPRSAHWLDYVSR